MIFDFKLPDLGEGIAEGDVVKWRVKEGDTVAEHQIIAEVETDKAIVEVPSPRGGKVLKVAVPEGETVKVGESLLKIEVAPAPEAASAGPSQRAGSASVVGTLPESDEVLASPKARSAARRLGIALQSIKGTGPGGIVTEGDVLSAKDAVPETSGPGATRDRFGPVEKVPIKGVRKSIARNLLLSQRSAAFVTGTDDADVTDLWALRERERKAAKDRGVHLTFMPFFIKAVQRSLASHPMLNASVDETGSEITVKKYYNIGVAVDTPDGLMVSVVKAVDRKTIIELASELQDLSRKARERKITLDELKGSTFTISNFGSYGGVYATPIINYPDVAILGTGRIAERPWVKDGAIAVRKILPLSLTFDHRVVDGSTAAGFLSRVVAYLEDPASIFIESA